LFKNYQLVVKQVKVSTIESMPNFNNSEMHELVVMTAPSMIQNLPCKH
jgi:hypothetical protein